MPTPKKPREGPYILTATAGHFFKKLVKSRETHRQRTWTAYFAEKTCSDGPKSEQRFYVMFQKRNLKKQQRYAIVSFVKRKAKILWISTTKKELIDEKFWRKRQGPKRGVPFLDRKQTNTRDVYVMLQKLRDQVANLEEKNRVLDAFIENSTDAIQISDRNLVTLRINRAYEVLTGIRREELVGIPVEQLVRDHLISESCGAIVAKTKKPHTIVQTFYRTGRSAHVSCTPVFDSRGEIEFYICNDRDLDEISSLQQELDKIRGLNDQYLQELESIKARMGDRNKLIVADKEMLKVLALATRVAKVDSTALLLGETGVGKDEIARFIHQNSSRSDRRFVPINCGAITESLFESELFGHEGYAFTGAGSKAKPGLLEAADHGTLFLDEVGELSLNMQTKLLHVLQNRSFIRVGGNEPVQVDIRVIAATNCDLEEMVREKRFREDLYYRLNVIPIHIPPLRKRKNDIIPLAQHFLDYYNQKYDFHRRLSPATCFALLNYRWEGNVRQLKNTIEQAAIITDTDLIQPESLPMNVAGQEPVQEVSAEAGLNEMLERMELRYLQTFYERYGSIRKAAERLKLPPTTFLRHWERLRQKYETASVKGER